MKRRLLLLLLVIIVTLAGVAQATIPGDRGAGLSALNQQVRGIVDDPDNAVVWIYVGDQEPDHEDGVASWRGDGEDVRSRSRVRYEGDAGYLFTATVFEAFVNGGAVNLLGCSPDPAEAVSAEQDNVQSLVCQGFSAGHIQR